MAQGEQTGIKLEIISPEKKLVSCMATRVSLPGTLGPFVILKNHAPLISSLGEGSISYTSEGVEETLAITSGFAEISDNFVTVCVEL